MPRFKINRKIKSVPVPEPVVTPQEEKIDDSEMMDVGSNSDDAIENHLAQMKLDNKPQNPPPAQIRPARPSLIRPEFRQPAKVARPPPKKVHFAPRPTRRPHVNDLYRRKAAMPNPRRPPQRRDRPGRLSYSSHYGPGGDYLDTHTKARMMYSHCFG